MHAALLRRINIQRSEQLSKININSKTNFFCIGDSKGFLQVINYPKIEAQSQPINREESYLQKQNCFQYIPNDHHKGSINLITWNICFNKLTTVGTDGSLVVWKKKNEFFMTEMVNKREDNNKSFITDVKWSKDGEYICFVYDDGQIYTGLVDGNHEWFNELEKGLNFVEFSPDNKKILIAKRKTDIYIFTVSGQQIGVINLGEPFNDYDIVSIDWWCDYRRFNNKEEKLDKENNNKLDNNNNNNEDDEILIDDNKNINENDFNSFKKHLMIAFKNGNILFFEDENDNEPISTQSELTKIMGAQWEPKGRFYIVVGNINDSKGDNKSVNNGKAIALFYNIERELIKRIVCPSKIFSFSLGNSCTIALEAQKIIYTGFIKYNYKWAFFSNTIVVGYLIGDNKYNLIYLDTENNTKLCKIIYNLIGLVSNDLFCVIFSENKGTYNILFTNNFGNALENRKCPIKPVFYSINEEYLVVSDGNYIYMLQFKGNINTKKKLDEKNSSIMSNLMIGMSIYQSVKLDTKLMHELVFFIDDGNIDINNNNYNYNTFIQGTHTRKTNNKILALVLSTNYLFISRSFGTIYRYDLSTLKIDNKYKFEEKIKKIGISPFETYLWSIDLEDILRIHNIKYQNDQENRRINEFSQKEVWEIEWCNKKEDYEENFTDTLSFVTVERNKLYFYSNLHHESDPYICTDYLAKYIDNVAIAVRIEDLIKNKNNSNIKPSNYIKIYENKILSMFNSMLDTGKNFEEIYDFVAKNPSKKLWQTLSQKAMENLDFDTAHRSMLQMNDFDGLDFLNQVKKIDDPELQKAEIAQFNSQYEEASKLYSKNGRNDLNLAMLIKLGKWDKISEMMNKSGNKSMLSKEDIQKMAYNNYADELFDKKEYDKAEENYKKSGNIKGITNCYFAKEDYENAAKMLEVIPEEDEFLEEMGNKFLGLGMCHEAAIAFTKHGNIKKGIESYISCNKWEEAIDLSAKNGFVFMEQLVNKFSDEFRLSGKKLDLINLYKKANMSVEVNKYLKELACDMKKANLSPLIIKKIYVLAALELERYKAQINEQISEEMLINDNNDEINELMNKKINYIDEALQREIDKIINNHWRGAEAYHYYLLCQVQLHRKQFKESCKTVMRLKFYEDILGTEEIYRLIALCSYLNKCYKFFDDALCILSNDEKINKYRRLKYKQLVQDVFLRIVPENVDEKFYKCPNPNCNEPISEYDTYCNVCGYVLYGCVLTGRSILDGHYFKCKQCRNKTIKSEVKKKPFKYCPLCHVALVEKKKEG